MIDYKKLFLGSVSIAIILAFLLFHGWGMSDKKYNQLKSMYDAAQAKEQHYITKAGLDSTEKLLLFGDVKSLKDINIKGNAEIERLKKLVNKNTIGATVFSTNTSGTITGSVKVVVPTSPSSIDTGLTDDFLARVKALSCKLKLDSACLPRYDIATDTSIVKGQLSDTTSKWIRVFGYATAKNFKLNYTVFNEFNITQQFKEEGKWYKSKKVPYVIVTNLNPYTKTTKIQSFAVSPPEPDKIILGLGTTFGYDLFNRNIGWTVGLTLNYRLIGF